MNHKSHRVSIALVIFIMLGPITVFGKQNNINSSIAKNSDTVDKNYTITLNIITPKTKETVTIVQASGDFYFNHGAPGMLIAFKGSINNGFLTTYTLGLRETISNLGAIHYKNSEFNEKVILTKNKQIDIFKTDERNYSIRIDKFIEK